MNVVPMPQTCTFDDFWQAYPSCRRERKMLAMAKWKAITNGGLKTRTYDKDSNSYMEIELIATPEEILAGAKRYENRNKKHGTAQFGYKDDGKYICQPATWLNQGRWMDE